MQKIMSKKLKIGKKSDRTPEGIDRAMTKNFTRRMLNDNDFLLILLLFVDNFRLVLVLRFEA